MLFFSFAVLPTASNPPHTPLETLHHDCRPQSRSHGYLVEEKTDTMKPETTRGSVLTNVYVTMVRGGGRWKLLARSIFSFFSNLAG